MKRSLFALLGLGLLVILNGCTRSIPGTPNPLATPTLIASPIVLQATSTEAVPIPFVDTPTMVNLEFTPVETIPAPGDASTPMNGIIPGVPSGPYAVILVAPGDALNGRSGPSMSTDEGLWVEIQLPTGGTGWVFADYLTEYVAPATFCADERVGPMLHNFGNAVRTADGELLSAQVSPVHGMSVQMWQYSDPITFDVQHARWVFDSTFSHDWGAAPGSGLETVGSFHEVVLPAWLDVLNAEHGAACDAVQTGGASYDTSWPADLANINYYSFLKPGPPGNELSWRTLLVGVEYFQGQPFIYRVTQMNWEP